MKATNVQPLPGYRPQISFNDGVTCIVNLNDLVKNGIFQVLKDETVFQKVFTDGYCITWAPELEIDVENLYAKMANIELTE